MRWLVCDYGGVLSLDQSEHDRAALITCSGGADAATFGARYWRHRPAYDRAALTARQYWTEVIGAKPSRPQLEELIRLDVASWQHPSPDALAGAGNAATRGFGLALLSNAPIEVARGLESLPWLAPFDPRFFSCDMGAIKPEPAIYLAVIEALGGDPAELVLFDDRDDNVVAAAGLGMEAHLFTDPCQFDRV